MHLNAIAIPSETLEKIKQPAALTRFTGFEWLQCVDGISPATLKITNSAALWSVIFLVDVMPLPPCAHSNIENVRLFLLHRDLRKSLNKDSTIMAARDQHINQLSRTLLSEQQWHEMRENARDLCEKYKTDDEVIKILVNHHWDKVEVIKKDNKQLVKKTFRTSFLQELEREIKTRQVLAHMPEISPIIDSGENYLTMPYYTHINLFANPYKPFPLAQTKVVIKILEKMWDNGYAMLDNRPTNFLYLPDNTVKIIDLESAIEHKQPDINFSDSFFFDTKQSPLVKPVYGSWCTWHKPWHQLVGMDYADIDKDNILRYIKHPIKQAPRLWAREFRKKMRIHHRRNIRTDAIWHYLPFNQRYYF